jgi:hypothetical protein
VKIAGHVRSGHRASGADTTIREVFMFSRRHILAAALAAPAILRYRTAQAATTLKI